MVEKMTKYSFILLSCETEGFLSRLQELGLMDITRSQKPVDEKSAALFERMEQCRMTADWLDKLSAGVSADGSTPPPSCGDPVEFVRSRRKRIEEIDSKTNSLQSKAAELRPWGEFSTESIEALARAGYVLHWYSTPSKNYNPEWEKDWAVCKIEDDGKKTQFVIAAEKGVAIGIPLQEMEAPEKSASELEKEIQRLEEEKASANKELVYAKNNFSRGLREEYAQKASELELYLADSAAESAVEETISLLVGFAPRKDDERLAEALDGMDICWFKDKATAGDNPPIKLKNNWFSRQFEVLTGMYGMPVYDEFDPTPILAPFFMLFFSMCLGDSGYGVLLILISLFMKFKMNGKGLAKFSSLIMTLGVSTVFVGTILGTCFGISLPDASWMPEWLKKCMITGEIAGYSAQMVLAIAIGVVHIILAMTVKAIGYTKRFGFRQNVSTWGWLLLLVGAIVIGALVLLGAMSSSVTKWVVIALGIVCGLGIYVFNTPGRNPLINIGAGLWDTYNFASGLMSDVLSYIRLYALGLSGGMLGAAFNDIGGMVFDACGVPGLNWLLLLLILVIGHTLNLAMSCLGAFVHPLRLTFVEYFKNSGYEGTGVAYRPLKKEENINEQ